MPKPAHQSPQYSFRFHRTGSGTTRPVLDGSSDSASTNTIVDESNRELAIRERLRKRRNSGPITPVGSRSCDSLLPETLAPETLARKDSPCDEQSRVIAKLSREVRKLETAGRATNNTQAISSGCAALDACLPHQGYLPGSVVEYLRTTPACGASYLAFACAAEAIRKSSGFLVVVDTQHNIYPPTLTAHGIDPGKVVLVRPQTPADAIWAVDQSLRTPAVACVVAELERVDDRAARRLQLASESGGGLALLLRSAATRRGPSWAEVQWLIRSRTQNNTTEKQPGRETDDNERPSRLNPSRLNPSRLNPSQASPYSPLAAQVGHLRKRAARQLELKLVRNRGGQAGMRVRLEINSVTGAIQPFTDRASIQQRTEPQDRKRHDQAASVRLATELAGPKNPSRRAAAS